MNPRERLARARKGYQEGAYKAVIDLVPTEERVFAVGRLDRPRLGTAPVRAYDQPPSSLTCCSGSRLQGPVEVAVLDDAQDHEHHEGQDESELKRRRAPLWAVAGRATPQAAANVVREPSGAEVAHHFTSFTSFGPTPR